MPPESCLAAERGLGSGDKKAINALLWALKPLANLRGSIPLPFVTTFLVVALDEGKGVGAYARALGIGRAAMSRYLRDIGARARNGGPGLGLVTVAPHPKRPMNRQVFLTAKGCALADEIFQQMQRGRWPKPSPTSSARSTHNQQPARGRLDPLDADSRTNLSSRA